MVANLTTFCFVGFGTDRLRRQEAMKTTVEKPKPRVAWPATEHMRGRSEQNTLDQVGCEARKVQRRHVFFLDFYFIEHTSPFRRGRRRPWQFKLL